MTRRGRRVGHVLAGAAFVPSAGGVLALAPLTGYLGLISACGVVAQRRRTRADPAASPTGARTRFAIMVPAHDECDVIADSVRSMTALDYPSDLFEVHVVADNCTDDTAALARAAGATVLERTDAANPGKGAALNDLHDHLVASAAPFDAFVVLDADTVVDPGFLRAMDRAFTAGACVAQGFYGVLDPDHSAGAGLRAAALACRHHLRPLGRNLIGGSCGLYGNGMALRSDVLATRRWSGHLTEDMEFQLELLLDGQIVTYVPDARIEAQMPDNLDAARTQSQRWELGRLQVLRTYAPILTRRLARPRGRSRVADADALMDQLVPPLSVLGMAQMAVNGVAVVALVAHPSRRTTTVAVASTIGTLTLIAHALAGLWATAAPATVYRSVLHAPRAMLWKTALWLRVLRRPDEVSWSRTERNRPIGDSR